MEKKKKLLFKICAPFVNEGGIKERPTIKIKKKKKKRVKMTKYTCAYVEAQKLTFILNT